MLKRSIVCISALFLFYVGYSQQAGEEKPGSMRNCPRLGCRERACERALCIWGFLLDEWDEPEDVGPGIRFQIFHGRRHFLSMCIPCLPLTCLASVEKLHILRVLNYTQGNKVEAAKLLNIRLTTGVYRRKMEEYGLN